MRKKLEIAGIIFAIITFLTLVTLAANEDYQRVVHEGVVTHRQFKQGSGGFVGGGTPDRFWVCIEGLDRRGDTRNQCWPVPRETYHSIKAGDTMKFSR